jgi:hypothetical protein
MGVAHIVPNHRFLAAYITDLRHWDVSFSKVFKHKNISCMAKYIKHFFVPAPSRENKIRINPKTWDHSEDIFG